MSFFSSLSFVWWREWKRALRDTNLVLVLFVAPLAYSALYGSIYLNKVETRVPVAVRDLDGSALSRRLVRSLHGLQNVSIEATVHSEEEARDLMIHERIQALFVIPPDFEKDLLQGRQVTAQLIVTPGRLLVLGDVGFSIVECAARFGASVTASTLARGGVPVTQNPALVQPLAVDFRTMVNPWLTYGDFILPALLAIILIQLAFMGTAALTARERGEHGWLTLFRHTEGRLLPILLGKVLVHSVIFTGFAALLRFTLVPLFHVRFEAALPDFLLLSFLAFLAATSLGLFVGTWFRTRIAVFSALGFTSYPFFMLSGYAWPQAQLPALLKGLAALLPSTPWLRGILVLTQMGLPLSSQLPLAGHLLLLTITFLSLTALRLRFLRARVPGRPVHGELPIADGV